MHKVDIGPAMSIITSNLNGLNTTMKRQILSDKMKKQDPTLGCLQKTQFTYDTSR